MIRHVVLFHWKPSATAADVSKVEAALHQLPNKIACIQSYRFGRDLGAQEGNADFALVADFVDEEALQVYGTHPDHLEVIGTLIRPITERRTAIQYVIDSAG
ncbi:MAG: Dabb family protein [Candidatus Dormibacteraeota bacterium]|nr:Dabb family protein [Candidatus Dormibacteraeota bacterium]